MSRDYMKKFNAPKDCVEGSKIPKKLFYEEYNMSSIDKKIFTNDIEEIVLEYMFSKNRINIDSYNDEEIEYEEIAVIRVVLSEGKKYKRICEIIQRAIPYSVIIICEYQEYILFNVSSKRINKNNEEKNTVEEMLFTEWICLDKQKKNEKVFLEMLNIREWSFINLYKFYYSFVEWIKIFNASKYCNDIEKINSINVDEYKRITDEIDDLSRQIIGLKDRLKHENQFNKKMDLNIIIKKAEMNKVKLIDEINGIK